MPSAAVRSSKKVTLPLHRLINRETGIFSVFYAFIIPRTTQFLSCPAARTTTCLAWVITGIVNVTRHTLGCIVGLGKLIDTADFSYNAAIELGNIDAV